MFSLREKRVEKPWTNVRKLTFAHRFPTLIHPLPTLRRVRKELTSGFFNNNIFLKEQSQNTALVLNLILAFNSPMVGVHLRVSLGDAEHGG